MTDGKFFGRIYAQTNLKGVVMDQQRCPCGVRLQRFIVRVGEDGKRFEVAPFDPQLDSEGEFEQYGLWAESVSDASRHVNTLDLGRHDVLGPFGVTLRRGDHGWIELSSLSSLKVRQIPQLGQPLWVETNKGTVIACGQVLGCRYLALWPEEEGVAFRVETTLYPEGLVVRAADEIQVPQLFPRATLGLDKYARDPRFPDGS